MQFRYKQKTVYHRLYPCCPETSPKSMSSTIYESKVTCKSCNIPQRKGYLLSHHSQQRHEMHVYLEIYNPIGNSHKKFRLCAIRATTECNQSMYPPFITCNSSIKVTTIFINNSHIAICFCIHGPMHSCFFIIAQSCIILVHF